MSELHSMRRRLHANEKKVRAKRQTNGVCIDCGKHPPKPNACICSTCRETRKVAEKERRTKRLAAGLCEKCGDRPRDGIKSRCCECGEKRNRAGRLASQILKDEVYARYGGYACACCGETTKVFLTIDHVNGDGATQRKQIGRQTDRLYRWLQKHDYPPGYQVLCRNCQEGKFRLGQCPHAAKKVMATGDAE